MDARRADRGRQVPRAADRDSLTSGTNGKELPMKTPLLVILIGVSSLCGIGTAHAKVCLKVSFPDQAQVGGSTRALNGLGLRQAAMFKVNVYVAALYVTKVSPDPNVILGSAPKQLILHFVRGV